MLIVERIVSFCCRRPLGVTALCLALGIGAGVYTAGNFAMNTDSANLITGKVAWRMRQARFDAAFPGQTNLTLVVIDGVTPERAEAATAGLAARLRTRPDLFLSVRRPDGGPFFDRNGLLFLSTDEVRETTAELIKAQPFLGALAADPSLRGVMGALSTALLGVTSGQARLADLGAPLARFAQVFQAAADGKADYLSWRALITGAAPRPEELRRFIIVKPQLDFTALEPGKAASDAIRADAGALKLDPAHGVRVRLTGDVPMSDEEFGTLADRAGLMVGTMLAGVLLTLWIALRSVRIILAILATLAAGLAITMAIGLAAVGVFNIISIAFVALFVGLGVDFGIQFAVRYRSERHHTQDLDHALTCTGRALGAPLALAAAATAAGFFSFLPTTYTGVAELGEVAGAGMIVAFLLSITLLPALLKLFKLEDEHEDVGFAWLAPADAFLARHRRGVIWTAALAGLASLALTAFVRFDSDPLDLRSPKVESVSTLFDLMKNPQTSPNTIDIPVPSLAAADALAARLGAMPEVGQTITLSSFIPADQDKKLALIADAENLLGPTITPFEVAPAPSDADIAVSFTATAQKLRAAAGSADTKPARDARALAAALDRLVKAGPAARARAAEAVVPGLQTMLGQVTQSLSPAKVTPENMPADLEADWLSANGTARIQVSPRDTKYDSDTLSRFSDAVLKRAPAATGAPISIRESGRTIVGAFEEAGALSFVAITILLFITLRRARDVLMTLLPLILTGLLTLGTCVVIGQPLNFANVIALPLLLGIGVAFNIYFVVAWRAGQTRLLQSSLTRAVIFSAATTATGFGALWLSVHPGTASMGELLMISLFWTLVTTLFLSPALLGPPPARHKQVKSPLVA